jgi:hypothetical protein
MKYSVLQTDILTKITQTKKTVTECTDGAKSMTGNVKGFVAKVREVNSDTGFHHCLLHHEVLVAKTLPPALKEVLDEVVKIVNFIKSKPLNSRLFFFFQFCVKKWVPNTHPYYFPRKCDGCREERC